jgi:hypothetical protein
MVVVVVVKVVVVWVVRGFILNSLSLTKRGDFCARFYPIFVNKKATEFLS